MASSYDIPIPEFRYDAAIAQAINADAEDVVANGFATMTWTVPEGVWMDWVAVEVAWYDLASTDIDVASRVLISDPDVPAPEGNDWWSSTPTLLGNAALGNPPITSKISDRMIPEGWQVRAQLAEMLPGSSAPLATDAFYIMRVFGVGRHV